jgi:hypothetical protein
MSQVDEQVPEHLSDLQESSSLSQTALVPS